MSTEDNPVILQLLDDTIQYIQGHLAHDARASQTYLAKRQDLIQLEQELADLIGQPSADDNSMEQQELEQKIKEQRKKLIELLNNKELQREGFIKRFFDGAQGDPELTKFLMKVSILGQEHHPSAVKALKRFVSVLPASMLLASESTAKEIFEQIMSKGIYLSGLPKEIPKITQPQDLRALKTVGEQRAETTQRKLSEEYTPGPKGG